MNYRLAVCLTSLLLMLGASASSAAPSKTFVAEFKVSGMQGRTELPGMLQQMLAARLSAKQTTPVSEPDSAVLTVTGSLTAFGNAFSLDVTLHNRTTGSQYRFFEQGSSHEEIIPALAAVARKIDETIAGSAVTDHAVPVSPALPTAPPAAVVRQPGYLVPASAPADATVKTEQQQHTFSGALHALAVGKTRHNGKQELFVADERRVTFLLKDRAITRQSEVTIPLPAKILAIDAADLDNDATTELFVSIIDGNRLASRVYAVEGDSLRLIATGQPWIFRAIDNKPGNRVIVAQKLNMDGELKGGVAEVTKNGAGFEANRTLRLPDTATVFNFNRFNDAQGRPLCAVLDEDGYLRIYAASGEELWKSADKFGGSEQSFAFSRLKNFRSVRERMQQTFLEQRISVLPDNSLLVPHNTGGLSMGNNRDFSKHSFSALRWNGSVLNEIWHTVTAPSYLADYAYLADSRELYLLEVVQKPGLRQAGKTVFSVRKVE